MFGFDDFQPDLNKTCLSRDTQRTVKAMLRRQRSEQRRRHRNTRVEQNLLEDSVSLNKTSIDSKSYIESQRSLDSLAEDARTRENGRVSKREFARLRNVYDMRLKELMRRIESFFRCLEQDDVFRTMKRDPNSALFCPQRAFELLEDSLKSGNLENRKYKRQYYSLKSALRKSSKTIRKLDKEIKLLQSQGTAFPQAKPFEISVLKRENQISSQRLDSLRKKLSVASEHVMRRLVTENLGSEVLLKVQQTQNKEIQSFSEPAFQSIETLTKGLDVCIDAKSKLGIKSSLYKKEVVKLKQARDQSSKEISLLKESEKSLLTRVSVLENENSQFQEKIKEYEKYEAKCQSELIDAKNTLSSSYHVMNKKEKEKHAAVLELEKLRTREIHLVESIKRLECENKKLEDEGDSEVLSLRRKMKSLKLENSRLLKDRDLALKSESKVKLDVKKAEETLQKRSRRLNQEKASIETQYKEREVSVVRYMRDRYEKLFIDLFLDKNKEDIVNRFRREVECQIHPDVNRISLEELMNRSRGDISRVDSLVSEFTSTHEKDKRSIAELKVLLRNSSKKLNKSIAFLERSNSILEDKSNKLNVYEAELDKLNNTCSVQSKEIERICSESDRLKKSINEKECIIEESFNDLRIIQEKLKVSESQCRHLENRELEMKKEARIIVNDSKVSDADSSENKEISVVFELNKARNELDKCLEKNGVLEKKISMISDTSSSRYDQITLMQSKLSSVSKILGSLLKDFPLLRQSIRNLRSCLECFGGEVVDECCHDLEKQLRKLFLVNIKHQNKDNLHLQSEIERLKQENGTLNQDLLDESKQNDILTEENNNLTSLKASESKLLHEFVRDIYTSIDTKEDFSFKISTDMKLKDILQTLLNDVSTFLSRSKSLMDELRDSGRERESSLNTQISDIKEKYEDSKAKASGFEEEVRNLNSSISDLKHKLEESNNEVEVLKNKNKSLVNMSEDIKLKESDSEKLKVLLLESNGKVDASKAEAGKLVEKVKDLESENRIALSSIVSLEETVEKKKLELREQGKTIEGYETKVKELERILEERKVLLQRASKDLSGAKKSIERVAQEKHKLALVRDESWKKIKRLQKEVLDLQMAKSLQEISSHGPNVPDIVDTVSDRVKTDKSRQKVGRNGSRINGDRTLEINENTGKSSSRDSLVVEDDSNPIAGLEAVLRRNRSLSMIEEKPRSRRGKQRSLTTDCGGDVVDAQNTSSGHAHARLRLSPSKMKKGKVKVNIKRLN